MTISTFTQRQLCRLAAHGRRSGCAAFVLVACGTEASSASSQITHQACEEGWSFIAEWTGVSLASVLNLAGVTAGKVRVFYPFDFDNNFWDSLDMADAFHPQTLLAYGMNGGTPTRHGARFGYALRGSWATRA
jgi:DMSO/TMAO reductase YedYZ molybdopterin-dependent catalytic subunit